MVVKMDDDFTESLNQVQSALSQLEDMYGLNERMIGSQNLARNCEDMGLTERIQALQRLKDLYESADRIKKELGKSYDVARKEVVTEAMEEGDLSSVRVGGVGNVLLRDDMYVSVSDKLALQQWLEGIGAEDLIQETVNAQQLKSTLKRRMQEGGDLPEHCVKITPYTMAVITK